MLFLKRHYNPDEQIEELKVEIFGEKGQRPSYKEVFSRPATKRSIIIIFGVKIFQQTSGISIVIFYTTSIFIVSVYYILYTYVLIFSYISYIFIYVVYIY